MKAKDGVSIFICFLLASVNAVQVQVAQGWLEGETVAAITGLTTYHSFKGIPYAKAPVGTLRFKAPKAPETWDGIRKATEHGSVCPQYDIFTEVFEPGDEDCLYLNVYTPQLNVTKRMPVLVFIHGGGYKSGSGNIDMYSPDFLMTYDIVVATINYRLDALGFLNLDTEEVPGNAGLKDQVAALKWIKNNIENFGGDPDNVTIMGQSAGGASVALHLISPMSEGLFNRAIPMSGVPTCDFSITYKSSRRPYVLAKLLGNDTNDPNEVLEFLQSVPSSSLVNRDVSLLTSELIVANNILKSYIFTPVVEKDFGTEQFLIEDPVEALNGCSLNKADILFGHTNEEAITGILQFENNVINATDGYPETITPRKILYNSKPDTNLEIANLTRFHYFNDKAINLNSMREFITYSNDAFFNSHIQKYFATMPDLDGVSKYFYIFSSYSARNYFGSSGPKYGIYGTGHLDDLFYIFNPSSLNMTIKLDSDEFKMVNLTCTLFTNFVKYGTPTPDNSLGFTWPAFNSSSLSYVEIANTTLTVGTNPDGKAIEFWDQMLDIAGV